MDRDLVHVASDQHLGAVPADRERSFLRWLERVGRDADTLVLNGDLFDFWFEYRHAIPRGHTRTLGALAALVDAGIEVHMLGGNHDWWGGSFLEEEVGLRFHRDPVTLDLAGFRTFVAHGDGLGAGDLGYRMLKLVLRGRLTRWAFRWLHPDVGARVAGGVSETERRWEGPTEDDRRRSEALARWAREHLEAHPDLDLVTLGHTHVPTFESVGEGRWYVNTGDWVHHRTYLTLRRGAAPRLERWEP